VNAAFVGAVGLDWRVIGFGNFSSLGETDIIGILREHEAGVRKTAEARAIHVRYAFSSQLGGAWQRRARRSE
jgi:hypothetical protein